MIVTRNGMTLAYITVVFSQSDLRECGYGKVHYAKHYVTWRQSRASREARKFVVQMSLLLYCIIRNGRMCIVSTVDNTSLVSINTYGSVS